MICVAKDTFIKEEERIIEEYRCIVKKYASMFEQFGCSLQLKQYWESWGFFRIQCSDTRLPMIVGYHCYAIVEVMKDNNCMEVFNENEEIKEQLFSKRLVSCISHHRKSLEPELYVISDEFLDDELNELEEDLDWFLKLLSNCSGTV